MTTSEASPPIRPVRDRRLSLWQSAAYATVREGLARDRGRVEAHEVHEHPVIRGVTAHARAETTGGRIEAPDPTDASPENVSNLAAVSKLRHQMAEAKRVQNGARYDQLAQECRKYATCDWPGWLTCEKTYLEYSIEFEGAGPLYYDWKKQLLDGEPDADFSFIRYRLPNDGRVALIGDWGTGMNDAKALLSQVMRDHRPSAFIHLGDVYYSGTPAECTDHFATLFDQVFGDGPRVPVFLIPGNHDYYAYGVGFYDLLRRINPLAQPDVSWREALAWQQDGSYFCLQSEDGLWQFLGMDTGLHDHNPTPSLHVHNPPLEASEYLWHFDKIKRCRGKTILLSHHQLFSAHSEIGDSSRNRNAHLFLAFQPYFDKVAAWFWGHEHNLAVYQDGLYGLAKGRLIGCSGYEETGDPYKRNFPQVKYQEVDGEPVRLGRVGGYFNHGYAIVDLKREAPTDPVSVAYYQLPSWGGDTARKLPADQKPMLYRETLGQAPGRDRNRRGGRT